MVDPSMPDNPEPPSKKTVQYWAPSRWIAQKLWRWDVTIVGAVALYALGANAMYGDDYHVAAMLYFAAVCWLTAKSIASEETRAHEQRRGVSVIILVIGVAIFVGSLGWINHRRKQVIAHQPGNPRLTEPPLSTGTPSNNLPPNGPPTTASGGASPPVATSSRKTPKAAAITPPHNSEQSTAQLAKEIARLLPPSTAPNPPLEVLLICTDTSLPITVPVGGIAYVLPLNEEVNKQTDHFTEELSNITGDKPMVWPGASRMHDATPDELVLVKCDVANHADKDVLELTLPLRTRYDFIKQPIEKWYSTPVVINPLDKGKVVSFYIINTCPVETQTVVTNVATARFVDENEARQFSLILPNPREKWQGYQLNPSRIRWVSRGCAGD